jgi:hypothetical protein
VELMKLIANAKLDLFFMSGSGLGAILLTLVAIIFVLKSAGSKYLFLMLSRLATGFKKIGRSSCRVVCC